MNNLKLKGIPMQIKNRTIKGALIALFLQVGSHGQAQTNSTEKLVRDLYASVSFQPGDLPNWEEIKEKYFVEQTIITLRTSKEKVSVWTVDEWVQDFVDFIDNRELENVGFNENIANLKLMQFGDMAHVLVLYEPRIPGIESNRQGVDSIHLIRVDGSWKIISLLNEIPTSERPIPEVLR
ncbi:MAG: hypothetical protein ABJG78_03715 [Cyclobacteriaceae bacterium]